MGRLIRTNGRATVTKIATAHLRYAKELLWTHKPWSRWDSAEDAWQNVTLSADSQFELQLSNGRVRICCKQHRSMAPSCLLFFFFFIYIFSLYCTDCVISQMQCNANCWFCIVHTGPEKMTYYAVTAVYYFTQSRGREWQNIFSYQKKLRYHML